MTYKRAFIWEIICAIPLALLLLFALMMIEPPSELIQSSMNQIGLDWCEGTKGDPLIRTEILPHIFGYVHPSYEGTQAKPGDPVYGRPDQMGGKIYCGYEDGHIQIYEIKMVGEAWIHDWDDDGEVDSMSAIMGQ